MIFFRHLYKKCKKFVRSLGFVWRYQVAKWRGFKLGPTVRIGPGTRLEGKIEIGNQTSLVGMTLIQGDVKIGDNVVIASHCAVRGINHDYDVCNALPYGTDYVMRKIIIEDNVWIGSNVKIIPGVHIGEGAIVGMGAVLTKNVPPCAVVAGNPAKVVKYRNIEQYERLKTEKKYLNQIRCEIPHHRRNIEANRRMFEDFIAVRGFVLNIEIFSDDLNYRSAILYELAMCHSGILFGNAEKYHIAIRSDILMDIESCVAAIAHAILATSMATSVDREILRSDIVLLVENYHHKERFIRHEALVW